MKIALIGFGRWGEKLLQSVLKMKKPKDYVCVVDTNSDTKIKAEKYNVDFFDKLRDGLNKTQFVIISTPEHTHFQIAKTCLEKGKDILVEKPLTTEFVDAKRLVNLASNNNLIIMVDSIFMYDKAFQCIEKIIKSGKIGKLNTIYSIRYSPNIIKPFTNVILDLMPHDISIFYKILDCKPKVINIDTQGIFNRQFDNANVVLNFNGINTISYLSWTYPENRREMVFYGDKGSIFWKKKDKTTDLIIHNIFNENNIREINKIEVINKEKTINNVLKEYFNCINKRNEPHTSGKKLLPEVKILEDILKHTSHS